jgi:hypothetical protein
MIVLCDSSGAAGARFSEPGGRVSGRLRLRVVGRWVRGAGASGRMSVALDSSGRSESDGDGLIIEVCDTNTPVEPSATGRWNRLAGTQSIRASTIASASEGRSSGSLARHCMIRSIRPAGMLWPSGSTLASGGGGSWTWLYRSAAFDSTVNGMRPASML